MVWWCSPELPSTSVDGESGSNHGGDVETALNTVLLLNSGHHFLTLGALVVKLLFRALNSIAGRSAGLCVMPGWGRKANKRGRPAVAPALGQTRSILAGALTRGRTPQCCVSVGNLPTPQIATCVYDQC